MAAFGAWSADASLSAPVVLTFRLLTPELRIVASLLLLVLADSGVLPLFDAGVVDAGAVLVRCASSEVLRFALLASAPCHAQQQQQQAEGIANVSTWSMH